MCAPWGFAPLDPLPNAMAIYHFSAQVISRSAGRSATASAAYRSGGVIRDEREDTVFDYTRKGGVDREASEILAPEGAPAWATDREALWNRVEASERRKDAQVAREIDLALPLELNPSERHELVRGFVKASFVDLGMVADINHHEPKKNPHAHIMLTMRPLEGDGFGKKERAWNDKALLESWREGWAAAVNQALEQANQRARVDHRSLVAQGLLREPQQHVGPAVWALAKKGFEWAKEVVHGKRFRPEPKVGAVATTSSNRGDLLRLRELFAFHQKRASGDIGSGLAERPRGGNPGMAETGASAPGHLGLARSSDSLAPRRSELSKLFAAPLRWRFGVMAPGDSALAGGASLGAQRERDEGLHGSSSGAASPRGQADSSAYLGRGTDALRDDHVALPGNPKELPQRDVDRGRASGRSMGRGR